MEGLGAKKFGFYKDVLEWVSFPEVAACSQPYDVLIKVAYSDVNPVDLQKLNGSSGKNNISEDNPLIPGYGGSGIVQEIGSKGPQQLIGKSVCFLGNPTRNLGSYASHVIADSRCVAEIPSNVDIRDAATIPVAGLTAYECLVKLGLTQHVTLQEGGTLQQVGLQQESQPQSQSQQQKPQQPQQLQQQNQFIPIDTSKTTSSLLIVGGSGGVGSWLLTLLHAFHPHMHIIATASLSSSSSSAYSHSQVEWCTRLGASEVIGHDEITTKLQGGKEGSVENIICLTEPTQSLFGALSEVIRPYGQICLVVAGKSIASLNLGFCFYKCVNVITQTVFSSQRNNYQNIVPSQELQLILQLLANQTIRVPLSPHLQQSNDISYSFKDVLRDDKTTVIQLLADPQYHSCGKFVLRIHPNDEIIFMDLKTASFMKLPYKDCIQRKILHLSKQNQQVDNKTTTWEEQTQSQQDRDELIKKITSHKYLGVVKVTEKQITDYEDGVELQEAENVKSLWGVQLKHRQKNIEGEELIFIDPRANSMGELSRKTCIEDEKFFTSVITTTTTPAKEVIEEAITDIYERDDIVQLVRQTLKLNLEAT